MATTKKEIASFQPVFPEQYPQECQSCKTPTVCEKFMVEGLKADTGCCIFICPRRHRKVAPSKSKIDDSMVADSTPGALDFIIEKNKKILLFCAFLLPCPVGKPLGIKLFRGCAYLPGKFRKSE